MAAHHADSKIELAALSGRQAGVNHQFLCYGGGVAVLISVDVFSA
jgi:hypothetical protein